MQYIEEYFRFILKPENLIITFLLCIVVSILYFIVTLIFKLFKLGKKATDSSVESNQSINSQPKKPLKDRVLYGLGLKSDYMLSPADFKPAKEITSTSVETTEPEFKRLNGFICTIVNDSSLALTGVGIALPYTDDFEYIDFDEAVLKGEEIELEVNKQLTSATYDISLVFDNTSYLVRKVKVEQLEKLRIYYNNIKLKVMVDEIYRTR